MLETLQQNMLASVVQVQSMMYVRTVMRRKNRILILMPIQIHYLSILSCASSPRQIDRHNGTAKRSTQSNLYLYLYLFISVHCTVMRYCNVLQCITVQCTTVRYPDMSFADATQSICASTDQMTSVFLIIVPVYIKHFAVDFWFVLFESDHIP